MSQSGGTLVKSRYAPGKEQKGTLTHLCHNYVQVPASVKHMETHATIQCIYFYIPAIQGIQSLLGGLRAFQRLACKYKLIDQKTMGTNNGTANNKLLHASHLGEQEQISLTLRIHLRHLDGIIFFFGELEFFMWPVFLGGLPFFPNSEIADAHRSKSGVDETLVAGLCLQRSPR